MAYQCTLRNKECDGCGECKVKIEPCPNCGETDYEVQYFIEDNWIGCDSCIKRIYFSI